MEIIKLPVKEFFKSGNKMLTKLKRRIEERSENFNKDLKS